MLTLISRALGAAVVLGLAMIGAGEVFGKVLKWKKAHDNHSSTMVRPATI